MSKGNKNKEKQRNSAGYESRTGKEKIVDRHASAGVSQCYVSHAKGPTGAGVLILVGWSVLELILSQCARECAWCPSPPVIPACRVLAQGLDSRKMG